MVFFAAGHRTETWDMDCIFLIYSLLAKTIMEFIPCLRKQLQSFMKTVRDRLRRWSLFYNDGMVMFFFQGTIAINGFSMVLPSLDHHHWMFFSCPEQLNRWPCHSLTHSLTHSLSHPLLIFDIKEQSLTLLTVGTFNQRDGETHKKYILTNTFYKYILRITFGQIYLDNYI